jgi:hypothetical protein
MDGRIDGQTDGLPNEYFMGYRPFGASALPRSSKTPLTRGIRVPMLCVLFAFTHSLLPSSSPILYRWGCGRSHGQLCLVSRRCHGGRCCFCNHFHRWLQIPYGKGVVLNQGVRKRGCDNQARTAWGIQGGRRRPQAARSAVRLFLSWPACRA